MPNRQPIFDVIETMIKTYLKNIDHLREEPENRMIISFFMSIRETYCVGTTT